ncbi:hypothetical protein PIB30_074697 [Stylosanthes scabra]|uniref:Uncharacterized protein n=1 Tax=Stylosanthes scabra TaxID=79078 RepID=A0ABU6UNL1_9FABA|nr:hypothetical protein [Stylosanthes scabra]
MKWYRHITRKWIGRPSATLGHVPASPTQTTVPSPSEEDETETRRGRCKLTGLAATRTRLCDDQSSSSSSQATQQSTPAPNVPQHHLPQQQLPQHWGTFSIQYHLLIQQQLAAHLTLLPRRHSHGIFHTHTHTLLISFHHLRHHLDFLICVLNCYVF